ncbi:hypothetical protein [Saccharicrinis sp. FJH62]|uniref:hypothetical protein n=1 Tax=Saccharicrinis sp. FJH62 TaxID=3344657 RepID=UPI0035D4647D
MYRIIAVISTWLFAFNGYTQEIHNKFNISLFVGGSMLGAKSSLVSEMIASGFDDTSPGGWFGGPTKHPNTTKVPVFDLEAAYFFSEKGGITINGGMADNVEVNGWEDIGIGNYLFLKSELWSLSVCYTYRTINQLHHFYAGPSYFKHDVKETSVTDNPEYSYNKFGGYLAYSYHMLNKEKWFLALKIKFSWTPGSIVGPYIKEHRTGIATSTPETHTSVFPETKINLTVINLGLSIGLQ